MRHVHLMPSTLLHLKILPPLVDSIILRNFRLENRHGREGGSKLGERLSATAADAHQQSMSAGNAQNTSYPRQVLQHVPDTNRRHSPVKRLDSMHWFSHRRRTGGRHPKTPPGNHKVGPSAAAVARCLQRAHTIRTHPGVSAALRAFLSLVIFCPWWSWPLTFDLWPWHSNSGEISVQCT